MPDSVHNQSVKKIFKEELAAFISKITEINPENLEFSIDYGPEKLNISNFIALSRTLNALLIINIKDTGTSIPLGYIPIASPYGSIITNGIEKVPVFWMSRKAGIQFYKEGSSSYAVLFTSNMKQVKVKFDYDSQDYELIYKAKRIKLSITNNGRLVNPGETEPGEAAEISEIMDNLSLDTNDRKIFNKILSRQSKVKKVEFEDILKVTEILSNTEIFSEYEKTNNENAIDNYYFNLLGDSLLKAVNYSIKKAAPKDKILNIEEIEGIFPRNILLRNEFRALNDGTSFPILNRLNPLSIISEVRKIKRGPIKTDRLLVPKRQRDVDVSHRYKICPIETPESEEIGLTLFLTKDAEINISKHSINKSNSMLGWSASLIPFIGHNEGARAIMGAKNMKQALLLKNNEPPFISTGAESELAVFTVQLNDNYQSSFIKENKIALGTNILVAYMPYRGLNFEDAIVISDRLQKDDILTSVHYHNLSAEIFADEQVQININKGDEIKPRMVWCCKSSGSTNSITNLNIAGEIKGIVESIEKLSLSGELLSPDEDFPCRQPEDHNRKIGIVKVLIKEMKKIQPGDKLTGRHGNKGVIGAIIEQDKMPHLPNGIPVDMILNPNGVISRMNLGQLLETHYAFLYKHRFEKYPDGTQLFNQNELEFIESSGAAFKEHNAGQLRDFLKRLFDFLFPLITGDYHSYGKTFLRDGKSGDNFQNPSVVGYQYFLKLDHLAEKKLNARSRQNEKGYNQITLQPLKGRQRSGGQRIGEMEFHALLAHNASYIIEEIIKTRSEFCVSGNVRNKIPEATSAFFHYLRGMSIEPVIDWKENHDSDNFNRSEVEIEAFSLRLLNNEEFIKRNNIQEVTSNISYEYMRKIRYDCPDGCTSHRLLLSTEFVPKNNLYDSDFDPDSRNPIPHYCPECKKRVLKEDIEDSGLLLKCTCDDNRKIKINKLKIKGKENNIYCCSSCNKPLELNKVIEFDFRFTDKGIYSEDIFGSGIQRRNNYGYIKLAKTFNHNFKKDFQIQNLLVIPPVYRPFRLNGKTLSYEGSPINIFYEKIINLNNEIKKGENVGENANKLQYIIEDFFSGGRRSQKSIFEMFQGKKGLIRGSVLGKRTDFSARAVIIPAPDIDLDECRLPLAVIQGLFNEEIEQYQSKYTDPLQKIKDYIKKHKPIVLLNRAPSLHKYNILAFYIAENFRDDSVIGIHPLVCGGFGADHDGDLMAVHKILSDDARKDAVKMLPSENLISDANSQTFLQFDQDIVLGIDYILNSKTSGFKFWKMLEGLTSDRFAAKLKNNKEWNDANTKAKIRLAIHECFTEFGAMQTKELSMRIMYLGFEYATLSGLSLSFFDLVGLRDQLIKMEIAFPLDRDISSLIRYEDECLNYLRSVLSTNKSENPVVQFVSSGARGKPEQLIQMVLQKGLVYTGRGEFTKDYFIISNFVDGLNEDEYFYSAFKSRDAMMDKKLMAPETGVLLRDLTEALKDIVISEEDCGTPFTQRTPFYCLSKHGVCQKCYGKKPLSDLYFDIGTKIGIIAAQSIGERSSQLSMQSIHIGKDNTANEVEEVKRLINPKISESRKNGPEILMKEYLPVERFTAAFKKMKSFSHIDDRHFSVLLICLIDMSNETKRTLLKYLEGNLNDFLLKAISEKKISVIGLKRAIMRSSGFLKRFGYSQTKKILETELRNSEKYPIDSISDKIILGQNL